MHLCHYNLIQIDLNKIEIALEPLIQIFLKIDNDISAFWNISLFNNRYSSVTEDSDTASSFQIQLMQLLTVVDHKFVLSIAPF